MRLVIDIPDWRYKSICKGIEASKRCGVVGPDPVIHEAIYKGTPLPKGHWIKHNTPNNTYYDCSLCGCVAPCTETADSYLWKLSNFCPDCGAKMEND